MALYMIFKRPRPAALIQVKPVPERVRTGCRSALHLRDNPSRMVWLERSGARSLLVLEATMLQVERAQAAAALVVGVVDVRGRLISPENGSQVAPCRKAARSKGKAGMRPSSNPDRWAQPGALCTGGAIPRL